MTAKPNVSQSNALNMLSDEGREDLELDMKEMLRDAVTRDATLACEEVDRLVIMALGMLPPEVRKMPAKNAFLPMHSLFECQSSLDGPALATRAVATPTTSRTGSNGRASRLAAAHAAPAAAYTTPRGVVPRETAAPGMSSEPVGSARVNASPLQARRQHGGTPLSYTTKCSGNSQETPEEKMHKLQMGMRALEGLSEQISTVSNSLPDWMSAELTDQRRSLLNTLENKAFDSSSKSSSLLAQSIMWSPANANAAQSQKSNYMKGMVGGA